MISVKNIFRSALLLGLTTAMVGCSDMLDTDSERQNFNPSIDEKTDSVFYAFGIFEAMQQLGDQYLLQGELRGDLVKTTKYTNNSLQQLADFSATTENKYDSAYVYYRVINNCNYYLAHRKQDLFTGSANVVVSEYAGVMAIRAWAYLQLGRNYERVTFFTEPLTEISKIDNNDFPELTLAEIVDRLAPELAKYSGQKLPTYNVANYSVGSPNWNSGQTKYVYPQKCFIPVDVVLGDMYLETGQYDASVRHYVTYLTKVAETRTSNYLAPMASKNSQSGMWGGDDDLPKDVGGQTAIPASVWSTVFTGSASNEIISYIPFAVNKQLGPVSNIPLIFGFNYYATSEEKEGLVASGEPYVEEVQLLPSDSLETLSDSTLYYYYYSTDIPRKLDPAQINSFKCGDMRLRSIMNKTTYNETELQWIDKFKTANIILYRQSTVLLHLAEALNRLGMPDAAFAILKDGLSENIVSTDPATAPLYMTDATKDALKNTYSILGFYSSLFPVQTMGIHCHGAGKAVSDCADANYLPGSSPYQMNTVVADKFKHLAKIPTLGKNIGTTKQDTINAIEDILCDEYALELAFEGNRYYDLLRLSNHKNGHPNSSSAYDGSPAAYGASYGTRWLENKLADRNWNESKRYLPFK